MIWHQNSHIKHILKAVSYDLLFDHPTTNHNHIKLKIHWTLLTNKAIQRYFYCIRTILLDSIGKRERWILLWLCHCRYCLCWPDKTRKQSRKNTHNQITIYCIRLIRSMTRKNVIVPRFIFSNCRYRLGSKQLTNVLGLLLVWNEYFIQWHCIVLILVQGLTMSSFACYLGSFAVDKDIIKEDGHAWRRQNALFSPICSA